MHRCSDPPYDEAYERLVDAWITSAIELLTSTAQLEDALARQPVTGPSGASPEPSLCPTGPGGSDA